MRVVIREICALLVLLGEAFFIGILAYFPSNLRLGFLRDSC